MKAGRIELSDKLLLEWLNFPKGKILDIRHSFFSFDGITELIIEDDDMPEVKKEFPIEQVTPIYNITDKGDIVRQAFLKKEG